MNSILLCILLIVTLLSFWRDKKQYTKFKALQDTLDRQRFYKRWTIEPFLLYGVTSLAILWYFGQFHLLKEMPDFLKNIAQSFLSSERIVESDFLSGIVKGILLSIVPIFLLGGTIGTILKEYQISKQPIKPSGEVTDFRNIDALIPKTFGERVWGAILSLNAGFSEEIFFRLVAPILIYNVTGSTVLAILCSTLWFGLAHYYQGISGVVATFLVGLLLFGIYIITQNIWITMLLHAVLDINGLVLSPWLKERFEKQ